jgi:hypothetical protein
MQIIEEMRNTISAQNLRSGHGELPSTCPDWAVKRIFEKRHGIPMSALPAGIRTLKSEEVRSFIAGPAKRAAIAPVATTVTDAERARMRRMLEVAAL